MVGWIRSADKNERNKKETEEAQDQPRHNMEQVRRAAYNDTVKR